VGEEKKLEATDRSAQSAALAKRKTAAHAHSTPRSVNNPIAATCCMKAIRQIPDDTALIQVNVVA
jgi:hypothetical protein